MSNNHLEFFLEENKSRWNFSRDHQQNIHEFSIVQIGKKEKMEPIDTLNEIKIVDDTFTNRLRASTFIKRATYKFMPVGLEKCRKLNKAKTTLINEKIINILGVINLDKINSWEKVKGKSIWVNANFEGLKDKKSDHFPFAFNTINPADLLSIYLKQKISITK